MMHRRAFTLIEMMIVCVIVALLAGILFTTLGPVREKTRVASCQSNLRQVHQALQMYTSDFDGAELVEGHATTAADAGYPTGGSVFTFVGSYVKSPAILHCPSFVAPPGKDNLAMTYTWHISDDSFIPKPLRFASQVERHGSKVILMSCLDHNADREGNTLKSFENKQLVTLRANGEVKLRGVPARSMYGQW